MAKSKRARLLPTGKADSAEQKVESRLVKRNLVAKFAKPFNKAHCHLDKKAAHKRGKLKHKLKYTAKGFSKEGYLINSLIGLIK